MTKKQTLFWLCLIVGLLVVNTFVHVTSPAYSEYRKNLDLIQNQYISFSNNLSMLTVVILTNRLADIERTIAEKGIRAPGAGAPASAPGRESDTLNPFDKERREQLQHGNAFMIDDRLFVDICGWRYSLGDNFGGSPIIDISPLGFRTADNVFYAFPVRNQSIKKGDS